MADSIKILVVDDNPLMLKGVTRLFRLNGFEVVEAVNGKQAIDMARELKPDLILLDVNLPDINGIEVCRRLKSDPATSGIFIVHLSAMHTASSSQVEGLEAGADGYIVQPISNQELLARIQSMSRIIQAEENVRRLNRELEHRVEERTAELEKANRILEAEIAERRKTESALRQSETRLRQITDNMNDIVLVTDNDGIVTYITPSVHASLGLDQNECIGEPLSRFFAAADREKIEEVIAVISRTGVSGSREFNMRHRNGNEYCFEIIAGPLLDDESGIIGVVAGARNITERKQTEQALRKRTDELAHANAKLAKASKLKDEFLSSMSHELRTPLIAVLGISEALQEEVYGSLTEKQHKSLKTIEESGRHLLSLINDILDISKIEAGKMELQYGPIHIEALCQSSIQFVSHTARSKNLDVQLNIHENTGRVLGDERRLKQILVNLLGNAVKFTEEGGRVGLDVKPDPASETVEFSVWDSGIGICHEDMERMFRPFVQLDSSLARQYNGTGLGLSIVRKLVDLHGGSISLESKPGKGSRFTVRLNGYSSADEEIPSELGQTIDISDFPVSHSILVIQESDHENTQISRYLQDAGLKTRFMQSTNGYLDHARDEKPDLIILDYNLPDDASKVIKALRNEKVLSQIPVIITSLVKAGATEADLRDVVCLTKPLLRQQLYHTLRDLTEKHVNVNPANGTAKIEADTVSGGQPVKGSSDDSPFTILLGVDNERIARFFTEFARQRRFSLITAVTGEDLMRMTSEYKPDLIVIDADLTGLDSHEAVRMIRRDDSLNASRILFTSGQHLPWTSKMALESGADVYIQRPFGTKTLENIIKASGTIVSTASGA